MSEYIVKIIPNDPYFCIDKQHAQEVAQYIMRNVKADSVEVSLHETPSFVDCGTNLERISCPCCNSLLSFDWWHNVMNGTYENQFINLSVQLPCCGTDSTLNDLLYDFPCGFSSVEFAITNPVTEINDGILSTIQDILDITVRVIHAHL